MDELRIGYLLPTYYFTPPSFPIYRLLPGAY